MEWILGGYFLGAHRHELSFFQREKPFCCIGYHQDQNEDPRKGKKDDPTKNIDVCLQLFKMCFEVFESC